MSPSRREQIEAMLAEDPQDVFLRYSLGMEMAKDGDLEGSVDQMATLLTESPPYVPAFFTSARHLAELGRTEAARDLLRSGIEQARAQGDAHAAAEMAELLTALGAQP